MTPPKAPKKGRFPRTTFPIYCTDTEWARIRESARTVGKTASAFCVQRALDRHGHPLSLSGEEQRELSVAVEALWQCVDALLQPLPDTDITLRDAVAFLFLALPESARQTRPGEDNRP